MSLFRRKPKDSPLSREEALACVPVRSAAARESRLPSGDILIAYPQNVRPWAKALLGRLSRKGPAAPPIKKLQLDRLGSSVWGMIDGRRSVKQIAAAFARRHRMPYREAEFSVTQFLRELGKRGLVGMKWEPRK